MRTPVESWEVVPLVVAMPKKAVEAMEMVLFPPNWVQVEPFAEK